MINICRLTIILFGMFFIASGLLMLIDPEKARWILRKAGSTKLINYAELIVRMIPAVALIAYAGYSKSPTVFTIIGWFMLITSFILLLIPRKLHHRFSLKSAEILKPLYFRFISPFALLIGSLIIYSVI